MPLLKLQIQEHENPKGFTTFSILCQPVCVYLLEILTEFPIRESQ